MSANVPTFNGIQMKIRRRSAEASEARNTLVGLCLTQNGEVGLNRLIQIILVETLGLTLQSNGSDKICMKGLFRTILISRQQRPAQQEKIPSPARIYWFRQTSQQPSYHISSQTSHLAHILIHQLYLNSEDMQLIIIFVNLISCSFSSNRHSSYLRIEMRPDNIL